MIFDRVSNYKRYFFNDLFHEIFEKIQLIDINTNNGDFHVNENYVIKVMSYETKLDGDIVENHDKYVDIQILLKGKERIGMYSHDQVSLKRPYDELSDCRFFSINKMSKPKSEIILESGYMAVFFHEDIHNPQLAVDNEIELLKKIVVKVNEKFFA